MKRRKFFLLIIALISLIISSCQSGLKSQLSPSPTVTNLPLSQTQPTNTFVSIPDRKTEIIAEIVQIASAYNQFVEDEKKTGNVQIVPQRNGEQGIGFIKESYARVFKEDGIAHQKIDKLNIEYYQIYKAEKGPVPTPTFSSPVDRQTSMKQPLAELQTWTSNELSHGTTVRIFSLGALGYTNILIGESYAKEQEKMDEIDSIRLSLINLPDNLKQLDIQQIQSIEPGAVVTLTDISRFPYYRNDIKLTTYETSTTIYNVYSQTHQIIEILPKQMPDAATATSISDLEKKAREMIAKISPDVNLDILTPVPGAKVGTYFFRWEDRTKPLLDDGRSYPFVQVGLNGNGDLLNYYNTLPLAR